MFFDKVGESVDYSASVGRIHSSPITFEGPLGGFDRFVEVLFVCSLNFGNDLFGCGVDGFEGLTRTGVHELTIDKQLSGADFDL